MSYSSDTKTSHSLPPLLYDTEHRIPLYVCCVRNTARKQRTVYLWTTERPNGRSPAPIKLKDYKSLQVYLEKRNMWPQNTSTETLHSSYSSSISSSSQVSVYRQDAYVMGAELTIKAAKELEQYNQEANKLNESCVYMIVYETILRMNSVRIFMNQVMEKTHCQLQNIHTFSVIETKVDKITYIHELLDVLFSVKGSDHTQVKNLREQTLRMNLKNCSAEIDENALQHLISLMTQCTINHDDEFHQQELYLALYQALQIQRFVQKVDLEESKQWFVPLVHNRCMRRSSCYGFRVPIPTGVSYTDRLLVDIPSTVYYVEATNIQPVHNNAINTYYKSKIPTILNDCVKPQSSTRDYFCQFKNGSLRSYLNQSRLPIQLYQIYNQIETSKSAPLFAIWHRQPGLDRRILRVKYLEKYFDPRSPSSTTVSEQSSILANYLKYVESKQSKVWLEIHNPDLVHFMDIVIYTKSSFYLCTLDRLGVIDIQLIPWHIAKQKSNAFEFKAPGASLTVSMERVVHFVIPIINKQIQAINKLRYKVALPHSPQPKLSILDIKYLQGCVYASSNINMKTYTATCRIPVIKGIAIRTLLELSYAFLPCKLSVDENKVNAKLTDSNLYNYLQHLKITK